MEPLGVLGGQRYVNEVSRRAAQVPAVAGDHGFGDFYVREYDQAVRLAWLLTGSQPGAEDVVQDAMAAVYRAFDRVESPGAYLRRAVITRPDRGIAMSFASRSMRRFSPAAFRRSSQTMLSCLTRSADWPIASGW